MTLCACGNKLTSAGKDHRGFRRLRRMCSSCRTKKYKIYKKDHCELCEFIPEWLGQLDVDHIDGNSQNNDINNLQTLCANCHRLKTWKCKDASNYMRQSVHLTLTLFDDIV